MVTFLFLTLSLNMSSSQFMMALFRPRTDNVILNIHSLCFVSVPQTFTLPLLYSTLFCRMFTSTVFLSFGLGIKIKETQD